MRLAIVGSRSFTDYRLMLNTVQKMQICRMIEGTSTLATIVSGGASGADSLAKKLAYNYDLDYVEFPALWDLYGKSAGYKRNMQIVGYCDKLIAFWDGKSKGTKHSIDLAEKQGKLLKIVYYNETA